MKIFNKILILIFILVFQQSYGQIKQTDSNIVGHVTDKNGNHIPFVTLTIKGTNIGTSTDDSGHYQLMNLPIGKLILQVNQTYFKSQEINIITEINKTIEVKIILEDDILGLDEVVITGSKNKTTRKESTTIVNSISSKIFSQTQSVNLSEGLNFCSGLRTENDCQNCGFNQVRMNGMEGPYSQIVINSRPVFSGLAGVYGLELIPANMIKKVEVIRGGGSALYGSNAIAGTINIILKEPTFDTFELGLQSGFNGIGIPNTESSSDESINFNISSISSNHKIGFALYGFYRDRQAFDANQDTFSEQSQIKNITLGNHIHFKLTEKSTLNTDFFAIKENRRGGNKFNEPNHMADISEAVDHIIVNGSMNFETLKNDAKWSLYASGQGVDRDSYYGAEQSLADYGKTKDFSYTVGTQYNYNFEKASLVCGMENVGSQMKDNKLGYPDFENATFNGSEWEIPYVETRTISNQVINTSGVFAQYEQNIGKFKFSTGLRFDHYAVKDNLSKSTKDGNVLSPRLSLKYDIIDNIQSRLSYSQGYRAPQIFDEDLHILTSGVRQVIHENDPKLTQESSHSYMMSFDFNKQWEKVYFNFLVEGFFTQLNNAFVSLYGDPDANGVVVYTRTNAEKGAVVQGINFESTLVPNRTLTFKMGFTVQNSHYQEVIEFNEKSFFRTPNTYGFLLADWKLGKRFSINSNLNYTGKMLVPYFGEFAVNPSEGELKTSPNFYDFGILTQYDVPIYNANSLRLFCGVKNLFNAYQSDFDKGIGRDPGYIYGPGNPRILYFGIKFGNSIM